MLSTALRVLVRCWPALLAWFLLGWTVRALIIRGASYLLNIDDDLAILVLPLAILAQLAAFVGMFFAIKRELPHVNRVDDVEVGEPAVTAAAYSGAKRCSLRSCRSSCSTSRGTSFGRSYRSLRRVAHSRQLPPQRRRRRSPIVLLRHRRLRRPLAARPIRRATPPLDVTHRDLPRSRLGVRRPDLDPGRAQPRRHLALDPPHVRRPRRRLGRGSRELRVDRRHRRRDRLGVGADRHPRRPAARLARVRIHHLLRHDAALVAPRTGGTRVASERWARMPVAGAPASALSSGVSTAGDRWHSPPRLIWRSGPIAMGTYLLAFAVITAASEWLEHARVPPHRPARARLVVRGERRHRARRRRHPRRSAGVHRRGGIRSRAAQRRGDRGDSTDSSTTRATPSVQPQHLEGNDSDALTTTTGSGTSPRGTKKTNCRW